MHIFKKKQDAQDRKRQDNQDDIIVSLKDINKPITVLDIILLILPLAILFILFFLKTLK